MLNTIIYVKYHYVKYYTLYTIRYSLSAIRYPLFAIRYSLFAIHYPLFAIRYPLFAIHYPLSTIHYPLSTIRYPLSTIHYPNFYDVYYHNYLLSFNKLFFYLKIKLQYEYLLSIFINPKIYRLTIIAV